MKRKPIVLIVAALVIAAIVFVWHLNRRAGGGGSLLLSGNIEATEVEVSFRIPGRIVRRLVDEGERVAKGQVVAVLDDSDLRREVEVSQAQRDAAQAALAELLAGSRPEEIEQARAAVRKAETFLGQLRHGSRPQEIEAARARVAAARAEKVRAEAQYGRAKELLRTQTISRQEFDAFRQRYESAAAELKAAEDQRSLVVEGPRREEIEQARAAWQQAQAQLRLVERGPRKETIDQARARLEQARAALALAETRLSYARLAAPLSGFVLSKNAEPGEYVSAGTPVVTVADLSRVWVRAYVDETDLGRVKLGQRAQVTVDTWPGKRYGGRVGFISAEAEFTPRSVQTPKERVKLVYRVKIDLENPEQELKPGMPADATLLVSEAGT